MELSVQVTIDRKFCYMSKVGIGKELWKMLLGLDLWEPKRVEHGLDSPVFLQLTDHGKKTLVKQI